MRAFVYCRVSTQEQATNEHYSLANQEARCVDYIKHKSWHCVKVLRDVGSGKSAEREAYQDLLRAIRERQVDVVVTYRLDRLSRNVVDVYSALDLFGRLDVAFVSVQESFDTTTAMGRAMLGVAAVFAQLTREMISENTKDGLLRRAQAGKYVGSLKARPYGYTVVAGALQIIPEEAEIVRRMFRLYVEQGWGVMRITELLCREGVETQSGLKGRWNPNTVVRMLRNPVYAGRIRMRGKEYSGEHEFIVSTELFQAARELSQQRAEMAPRGKSGRHLLSGIAKCGECGRNLVTHQQKRKGAIDPVVNYRHRALPGQKPCPSLYKNAAFFEQAVVDEVRKLCVQPDLRERALQLAREEFRSQEAPLNREREELLGRLGNADKEFEKWAERLTKGLIDEEQFALLNQKQMQGKKIWRERLEEIDQALATGEDIALTLDEVQRALADFAGVWETLSTDERREMMRSIVEYLKVYHEHAELKLLCLPAVQIDLRLKRGRKRSEKGTGTTPDSP